MKTTLLLFAAALMTLAPFGAAAQTAPSPNTDTLAFRIVEQMPTFHGDLQEFLRVTVRYPDAARERGAEGRVVSNFVVSSSGALRNIEIVRSSGDSSLDAEALRVIRAMPPWNPGKQNGKAVNVIYTLPLTFKLD